MSIVSTIKTAVRGEPKEWPVLEMPVRVYEEDLRPLGTLEGRSWFEWTDSSGDVFDLCRKPGTLRDAFGQVPGAEPYLQTDDAEEGRHYVTFDGFARGTYAARVAAATAPKVEPPKRPRSIIAGIGRRPGYGSAPARPGVSDEKSVIDFLRSKHVELTKMTTGRYLVRTPRGRVLSVDEQALVHWLERMAQKPTCEHPGHKGERPAAIGMNATDVALCATHAEEVVKSKGAAA